MTDAAPQQDHDVTTRTLSEITLVLAVSATPGPTPHPTGYSGHLSSGAHHFHVSGAFSGSTLERTALHALRAALQAITVPARVHVVTSSTYLTRGLTDWIGRFALNRHANGDLWTALLDAAAPHDLILDLRADEDPALFATHSAAQQVRTEQAAAQPDPDQTGQVPPPQATAVRAARPGQDVTPRPITPGDDLDPSLADFSQDEQLRLDAAFERGRAQIRSDLKLNPYLIGHTLLLMDLDQDPTLALARVESMLLTALAAHHVALNPGTTGALTDLVSVMYDYMSGIPREVHAATYVTTSFSDTGNWTAHTVISGRPLRLIILKDERTDQGRVLTGLTTPQARLVTLHLP